ncbi:hypothetical protein AX16_008690 [Volvariella volvacea WC 439]|nr:hypothetical protein AX16_008690 [Volvariella volvacea WC 439]
MAERNGISPANGKLASGLSSKGVEVKEDVVTWIPATHDKRTLVLCFDGTGDQFDADNSNIVELFGALKKDDPDKQMVYYQAGIGTWTSPQIATPMVAGISKKLDEAIAWNLDAHIMDGYEFLMQNYKVGDRICLFGFSRGAYTASCLAGMIHKVGLLPICNHQQVPFAYKMYKSVDEDGWRNSNLFKKTFSIDVGIEFVGLWDTVNSVGLYPKRLPFTTSNNIVNTYRHALALDEHRAKFRPKQWRKRPPEEALKSTTDQTIQSFFVQKPHQRFSSGQTVVQDETGQYDRDRLRAMEMRYGGRDPTKETNAKEVWFSGCHCDVGGGSVPNRTKNSLARIPLRWMIRECFKTDTGITFEKEALIKMGFNLDSLSAEQIGQSRPEPELITPVDFIKKPPPKPPKNDEPNDAFDPFITEEEHEKQDALSPEYDQLKEQPLWWLLEIMPLRIKDQNEVELKWTDRYFWWAEGIFPKTLRRHIYTPNASKPKFRINLGKGRKVRDWKHRDPESNPEDKIKVHRSVKMRIKAGYQKGVRYTPRLQKIDWNSEAIDKYVEWVD